MVALRGLYDSLRCPWISVPSAIREAENKPKQLRLALELGLPVLDSLVTQDPFEARRFVEEFGGAVIKPLYHG
jgi:glutathione synthase/RimK-type ligase-like ATP-grasp enzyme